MNKTTTLLALALGTLALVSACSGANDVTGIPVGCAFGDDESVEKNGPCEPCLQSDPERRDKNKPCIPNADAPRSPQPS